MGISNNKNGYVYFISNGSAIKIGFTKNNPEKRLKQLQTGNSKKLKLVYTIPNCEMEFEKFLHRYFEGYKIKLEWFEYDAVMKWINNDRLTKKVMEEMKNNKE